MPTAKTETTRPAEAPPRYASVADYLRVIRRRRLLIAGVAVLFTAGALVISTGKQEVYEASASLQVRDVFQDLRLISGGNPLPELAPAQRAAVSAQQVASLDVARAAARELDGKTSPQALLGQIDTRVAIQTNLISVIASSPDPARAAAVANAFADAANRVISSDVRRRLVRAEESLRDNVRELRDDALPGASGVLELQLSQITALREIARPVEIAQRAAAPADPVSPNPERDAMLGAALGLIFGLLVAFARDSLDSRLRSSRDVHDELGIPVLGRISESTFGSAGLARNGTPITDADFEAFRVLRTNLAFAGGDTPPRVVLVTSGLPEEGKSTVSMSLASAAALARQKVLLVECDMRRPSFARRLRIPPAPGLADYLRGKASPGDVLRVVSLTSPLGANGRGRNESSAPAHQLVCITAGESAGEAAELLAGERFRDFLDKVGKAYDLVVLDAGPLLAVVDPLEIVPHVDLVLVCARIQRTTREEAHATRSALSHLPDKPMGAVVTGITRGAGDANYYYDYAD